MAFLFQPPRTNRTATLSHPSARRYCSRISFNYTQQFYGSQETSIMLQRILGKHYSAFLCKHQSCCRSSPLWNSALQTLLQGSTLRALIFSEKINLKIYPLPSYSSAVDTCDVVDARIADIIRTSSVRHGPTWLKHAAKEFHKPATLLLLCAFDRFCLMIFRVKLLYSQQFYSGKQFILKIHHLRPLYACVCDFSFCSFEPLLCAGRIKTYLALAIPGKLWPPAGINLFEKKHKPIHIHANAPTPTEKHISICFDFLRGGCYFRYFAIFCPFFHLHAGDAVKLYVACE